MAKNKSKKKGGWFMTGEKGRKQVKEETKRRASGGRYSDPRYNRWWLKKGDEGYQVALDSPDFYVYEHSYAPDQNWKAMIHETCIKNISDDDCPMCEEGVPRSLVSVSTIIDCREFEDSNGKKRKNTKKLLVAKSKTTEKLLKQMERRDGDLSRCVYLVSRGESGTEERTGEDWEFVERLSKKKLLSLKMDDKMTDEEFLEPFDYEELFKPKTAAELRKILGTGQPIGAEEDEEPEEDEDTEEESDEEDDDSDDSEDDDEDDDEDEESDDDEDEESDEEEDDDEDEEEPEEEPEEEKPTKGKGKGKGKASKKDKEKTKTKSKTKTKEKNGKDKSKGKRGKVADLW